MRRLAHLSVDGVFDFSYCTACVQDPPTRLGNLQLFESWASIFEFRFRPTNVDKSWNAEGRIEVLRNDHQNVVEV